MDWRPLPYGDELLRLYVGQSEVARLCERTDGTWYACLNQHLPYTNPERRMVDCTSLESGRAGVEEWARRHAAQLAAEVGAKWERVQDRVG